VLQLQRGEVRLLAEPREDARRIEIHTPAAIATVTGAAVYVAVDSQGATTIASGEKDVRVESARRLGSSLTLHAGQQVTLRPGAALPKSASAWDPSRSPADGCLIDFRALAYDDAKPRGDARALDAIGAQDLVDGLPAVSAGAEGGWEVPASDRWIDPMQHRILEPTDTGAVKPER
jgi:hypothetical protein